jgi:hypothetical protein
MPKYDTSTVLLSNRRRNGITCSHVSSILCTALHLATRCTSYFSRFSYTSVVAIESLWRVHYLNERTSPYGLRDQDENDQVCASQVAGYIFLHGFGYRFNVH